MKQTAIEWLVEQINSDCLNSTFVRNELIEQAKAMEKEQMLDIYINHNQYNDNFLGFDDYYNETFKSE
jgi:hypothetical protein